MASTAKHLIEVAHSQIGYLEGDNDNNKYGIEYGMNHDLWCQMFVWWVFKHAGAGGEMPKTASTRVAYAWYKKNRQMVKVKDARPGDPVWFEFNSKKKPVSHVEIVVHNRGNGVLETIGGNTTKNGHGGREGVFPRVRSMKIVGVGRPHFLPGGVSPSKAVHLVEKGDTFSGIAKSWGVSLDALKRANPHAGHPAGNIANIWPGDKILHP
jgi:LysM repeat protein